VAVRDRTPRDLQALCVLGDEARWRIYWLLRQAGDPLTRSEVAERACMPLRTTTFHLERLLDAGLLTSSYARPAGRSGPGAGRSAKYYQPAGIELDISIPPRCYALMGGLLVEALQAAQQQGEHPYEAALRTARERGRSIAQQHQASHPVDGHASHALLGGLLDRLGYESYQPTADVVALRNCPFQALAEQTPELVCALNQALLQGILTGLGDHVTQALLAGCHPGDCCPSLHQPPSALHEPTAAATNSPAFEPTGP